MIDIEAYIKHCKVPIVTSRGCQSQCTYCATGAISGKRIRTHSIEYVSNQIKILISKGVNEFLICDDNLLWDKQRGEALLKLFGYFHEFYGVQYYFMNGINPFQLTNDTIKLLAQSGCRAIGLGIQSASPNILSKMHRKLPNVSELKNSLRTVRTLGIKISAHIIVGYINETIDELKCTIDLINQLPITNLSYFVFTPLPGTVSWDELIAAGFSPEKLLRCNFNDIEHLGEFASYGEQNELARMMIYRAKQRILSNINRK